MFELAQLLGHRKLKQENYQRGETDKSQRNKSCLKFRELCSDALKRKEYYFSKFSCWKRDESEGLQGFLGTQ